MFARNDRCGKQTNPHPATSRHVDTCDPCSFFHLKVHECIRWLFQVVGHFPPFHHPIWPMWRRCYLAFWNRWIHRHYNWSHHFLRIQPCCMIRWSFTALPSSILLDVCRWTYVGCSSAAKREGEKFSVICRTLFMHTIELNQYISIPALLLSHFHVSAFTQTHLHSQFTTCSHQQQNISLKMKEKTMHKENLCTISTNFVFWRSTPLFWQNNLYWQPKILPVFGFISRRFIMCCVFYCNCFSILRSVWLSFVWDTTIIQKKY